MTPLPGEQTLLEHAGLTLTIAKRSQVFLTFTGLAQAVDR